MKHHHQLSGLRAPSYKSPPWPFNKAGAYLLAYQALVTGTLSVKVAKNITESLAHALPLYCHLATKISTLHVFTVS
jgi:hypothetical protein